MGVELMDNKRAIFFLFSLLLVSLSLAESVTFWKGYVFIGGQPATNGTVLEAFRNNATLVANYTVGTVASGRDGYYIIPVVVATIDGGHNVSFRVNGVYPYTGANASDASLQPVAGFGPNLLNISINLTANGGACRPYTGVTNATSYSHAGCSGGYCVHDLCRAAATNCGDSFCDSGETTSSCSADCGSTSSSSGGGSSSSSSGGAAVEVTVKADSVPANTPKTLDIPATDAAKVAVDEVIITTTTTATSVVLTVKESSKPADAPAPVASTGAVYKYVDITLANVSTNALSSAKVKFKVTKSWVTSNSIDVNTVKLNRLVGTTWSQLSTTKASEDSADINYEADTPGFSTFAITGEKVTAAATPSPTPTPTAVATPTPRATPTPVSPAPAQGINLMLLAALIIIIIAGYAFFRMHHHKKKRKHPYIFSSEKK